MNAKPPLNWLRSFVVAARLQSFTRAAQELSLTQAAVSKHIKGLEAWLSIQLFIRKAHGLALTEQGKHYYQSCEPLIDKLDTLTDLVAAREQHSTLRLRCNISYSALLLPQKLSVLASRLPGVDLDINNGIWEPDRPSENAHLEIGYAPKKSLEPGDSLKLLAEDQLFPVVAPHVRADQWLTLPLIQVLGYTGDWQWWLQQQPKKVGNKRYREWLHTRQSSFQTALRTDNSLTGYQLCAQGLGFAMARTSLVQPMLSNGQLQPLKPSGALPAPDLFFARLTERGVNHPAAQALFELL